MLISRACLLKIMPLASARLDEFVQPLNDSMEIHEINNRLRMAAFLAQVAHESGELRYMSELASGDAYDTGKLAERLGNTPEDDDDGEKFKGRGPIQITGTDNYRKCSLAIYGDERLLKTPELLERPFDGCMASAWFWKDHGLNELADAEDFLRITKIINGGTNGLESRQKYYDRALQYIE